LHYFVTKVQIYLEPPMWRQNPAQGGSNTAQGGSNTAQGGSNTAQGGSDTAQGGSNTALGGQIPHKEPKHVTWMLLGQISYFLIRF
jgi:hypothetical protein